METNQTIDKPAKLRAMIAYYGIRKGAFAALVGVSPASLSQVLNGNENPSLALLERACVILTEKAGKPVTIGDIWD